MPLEQLDHYSLRTSKLDETRDFYQDVIGLTDGYRPTMPFPGYWLYLGEKPVIHLLGYDEKDPEDMIKFMANREMSHLGGSGAVDHMAFKGSNADDQKARLEEKGVPYRTNFVKDLKLTQFFIEDPNGVMVELNFFD